MWLYLRNEGVEIPEVYLYLWQSGTARNQLRVSQFFSIDTAKSLVQMNEYYTGARHYSSYTTACLDYISRHLFEPLDLELLSQKIGLNRRSLNEYFKADTGETLAKYILHKRLEEAAFLLMNTGLDISAIAELLHFSSQSHFSEKFKQQYHVTPLKYRLNHGSANVPV